MPHTLPARDEPGVDFVLDDCVKVFDNLGELVDDGFFLAVRCKFDIVNKDIQSTCCCLATKGRRHASSTL